MEKKTKEKLPKIYKRIWLNSKKGTAYIVIDAEYCKAYSKKDHSLHGEVYIAIKDCYRETRLEFDYWSMKEYKERLQKIQRLIDSLEEVKTFMIANPPVIINKKNEDEEDKLMDL